MNNIREKLGNYYILLKRIIIFVLILDIASFIVWTISGQIPQDRFFLGMITYNIISFLIH